MGKKKDADLGFEPAVQDDGLGFEAEVPALEAEAMSPDFTGSHSLTPEAIRAAGNLLDFADSPVRQGVSEIVREGSFEPFPKDPIGQTAQNLKALWSGGKAAIAQLGENLKNPIRGPEKAPLYSDIVERELDKSPAANLILGEKEKKVASGMIGFAADLVAPSALAKTAVTLGKTPKAASKLQDYLSRATDGLKNFERKQMAKVMAKMETTAQFKNSKIDPDKVAAVLVDNELTPHAGDPAKIYEALTGEKRTNYVEVAPGLSKESIDRKDGLIARKSKGMRQEIEEVAKDNGLEVTVPGFAMKQKLKQKSVLQDPLSGRVYTPEEVAQRQEIVDGLLKPFEEVVVPGVPVEYAQTVQKGAVPPPVPLEPGDKFPPPNFHKNQVKEPAYPSRPEHPGMDFPGGPEATQESAVIPPAIPPKPEEPQAYGGIISKELREKYDRDLRDWETTKKKLESKHEKELSDARKLDEHIRKGRDKTSDSVARDVNSKYDSAVKAWEEEVSQLKKEFQDELEAAGSIDSKIEEAKVRQAADRFMEKAKRNKAYRQEIMDADENYAENIIPLLRAKGFNQPRSWTLQDMMQLRTNIGKRLSSAEFHSDKPLTLEKEVLEGVYHGLKEEIMGALKGKQTKVSGPAGAAMDAADYYEIQSNAIRRMMEAEEILKTAMLNEHKNPDLAAKMLAGLSAAGVGGSMGGAAYLLGLEPSVPLGIAGVAGVAETYRQMKKGAPAFMARGAKAARSAVEVGAQHPEEVIKGLGAATRAIRDNYVMPQPGDEGYVPPQTRVPTRMRNIPLELIKTPLERDPAVLWGQKELVLAKVAQQAPDHFGMVAEAVGDPQKFEKVLGYLANFPQEATMPGMPSPRDLFKADKYSTWGGRILDPKMKMLAMDDVRNNDGMDSIQKASMLNKIQKGDKLV
jgi:hypothetical protein